MINIIDLIPSIKSELILRKQTSLIAMMKRKPKFELPALGTPDGDHIGQKEVVDVKLADDGSIRTYVKGVPYPIRVYPAPAELEIIASFKRLFILLVKNGFWGIISLYFNKKVWSEWIRVLFEKYQIPYKDEHWSQPVKELRRVLKGKIDDNFLDAISAILEYDGAYRYRFQDMVGELRKENFGYKEIVRLCDLFLERETDVNIVLYRKLRKFIWIFRFIGLKQIKQIVKEINIDEIKFSVEDLYHTDQYKINECGFYRFGGK